MANRTSDKLIFRKLSTYLLYFSILAVLVYLFRIDLFDFPEVVRPGRLVLSIVFLVLGYVFDARAWKKTIEKEVPQANIKNSFISAGKYIFSKYIPGKFWIILGKASYFNTHFQTSLVNLSSLSIYYQLLNIFSAIFIGLILLYKIFSNNTLWFFLLWIVLIGLLLIFYKSISTGGSRILSFFLRKNIKLPHLPLKATGIILSYSIINWIIWAFAFSLMVSSLSQFSNPYFFVGLVFPLSAVLGIVALFAPGGIGVREGVMVFFLFSLGYEKPEAISISFFSRVWFLIGEIIVFLFSLILSRPPKNEEEKFWTLE